jgi:hypothetical protein
VESEAVLFVVSGSGSVAATVAVFVMVPLVGGSVRHDGDG